MIGVLYTKRADFTSPASRFEPQFCNAHVFAQGVDEGAAYVFVICGICFYLPTERAGEHAYARQMIFARYADEPSAVRADALRGGYVAVRCGVIW